MDELEQNKLLGEYKHGFSSDVVSDRIPEGLSAEVVKIISNKKNEPEWMLDIRLKALAHFWKLEEPSWSCNVHTPIDYQNISYYSAPKKIKHNSLDEIDPEILNAYNKLGIPLSEQKQLAGVAVEAVFDSVAVATTFQKELRKCGVIFCPISEAISKYPELVKKYLFSVVPYSDNKYACLNAAVFSDGSFVYIPEGVKCPMELSTYFRINDLNTGQFERTLIIAEKGSHVSYLEGCTAPIRKESQLHAAVVELVALDDAEIKYSTVQNWYPGDDQGQGGILNFVTKRGLCKGKNSKISWTQVEVGSSITWKYPSCVLKGDNSQGFFSSIAVTNKKQQADTGSKMIHIGKNTKSQIISKGVSLGHSIQTYRGLVDIKPSAYNASNYTRCDSLMLSDDAIANTIPYVQSSNGTSTVEHEASASKIRDDQLFYCEQRGMTGEEAVSIVVSGFCKEVIKELPMEFAIEARKLLMLVLEGCVG